MRLDFGDTIRTICDGFLTEANYDKNGVYLGFDLRVTTDTKDHGQRAVAVGVHLLRFHGRILGCANRDFLFPNFRSELEWESISTHDSCWTDSTECWVGDIVRDIMEKKKDSKYVEPYREDKLTYGKDGEYDIWLSLDRSKLIDIEQLRGVAFTDPHSDRNDKRPLIRPGVCLSA